MIYTCVLVKVHQHRCQIFNSSKLEKFISCMCNMTNYSHSGTYDGGGSTTSKTYISNLQNSGLSVHFSLSVVSDSLRPHGVQHARPPYSSPTPTIYSNSCALSQWCHPTISPSVTPFSSRLQSFPASGSFPVSQFFVSSGQSIGVSASTVPSNEHPGLISFRMDWLNLLAVQGTLKSLLPTPQFKSINSSTLSFLYSPTLTSIHDYWKNHSFD